jgi:hypothetical protein
VSQNRFAHCLFPGLLLADPAVVGPSCYTLDAANTYRIALVSYKQLIQGIPESGQVIIQECVLTSMLLGQHRSPLEDPGHPLPCNSSFGRGV